MSRFWILSACESIAGLLFIYWDSYIVERLQFPGLEPALGKILWIATTWLGGYLLVRGLRMATALFAMQLSFSDSGVIFNMRQVPWVSKRGSAPAVRGLVPWNAIRYYARDGEFLIMDLNGVVRLTTKDMPQFSTAISEFRKHGELSAGLNDTVGRARAFIADGAPGKALVELRVGTGLDRRSQYKLLRSLGVGSESNNWTRLDTIGIIIYGYCIYLSWSYFLFLFQHVPIR